EENAAKVEAVRADLVDLAAGSCADSARERPPVGGNPAVVDHVEGETGGGVIPDHGRRLGGGGGGGGSASRAGGRTAGGRRGAHRVRVPDQGRDDVRVVVHDRCELVAVDEADRVHQAEPDGGRRVVQDEVRRGVASPELAVEPVELVRPEPAFVD